jgi:AraC-like DNA-binding protein
MSNRLGDPFNPKTGVFADNIRSTDDGDNAELKASLKQFGWVAEFPAIKDEHGVVLIGHRRLKLADELNITPVIKTLALGSGDVADAERLKLAIVSNIGGAPMTKQDRQRIAEHLYGERDWTMQRVAEALGVSQKTVSKDLSDFIPKVRNVPRGKGRPKNTRLKVEPVKFSRAEREAMAKRVLDEGRTYEQAIEETAASSTVLREALAFEQGRRAEREEPVVDAETFLKVAPKTWAEKFEISRRQLERTFAAAFEQRVQDECRQRIEDLSLPSYLKQLTELEQLISNRKGVLDRAAYRKILACLHPDSRKSVSIERLTEAFNLFSKVEKWFLDEKASPTNFMPLPKTYEEMMAMREKVRAERAARRGSSNLRRR